MTDLVANADGDAVYGEFNVLSKGRYVHHGGVGAYFGAVVQNEGLNPDKCHTYSEGTYFMWLYDGGLRGSGAKGEGALYDRWVEVGDRIGVLVKAGAEGFVRFFKNGESSGVPYFTAKCEFKSTLVVTVQMREYGTSLELLPNARRPDRPAILAPVPAPAHIQDEARLRRLMKNRMTLDDLLSFLTALMGSDVAWLPIFKRDLINGDPFKLSTLRQKFSIFLVGTTLFLGSKKWNLPNLAHLSTDVLTELVRRYREDPSGIGQQFSLPTFFSHHDDIKRTMVDDPIKPAKTARQIYMEDTNVHKKVKSHLLSCGTVNDSDTVTRVMAHVWDKKSKYGKVYKPTFERRSTHDQRRFRLVQNARDWVVQTLAPHAPTPAREVAEGEDDDDDEWQVAGHGLLGRRVRCFFDGGHPKDGRITKWLRVSAGEPPLFHAVYDDGDEGDLEQHEVAGAIFNAEYRVVRTCPNSKKRPDPTAAASSSKPKKAKTSEDAVTVTRVVDAVAQGCIDAEADGTMIHIE